MGLNSASVVFLVLYVPDDMESSVEVIAVAGSRPRANVIRRRYIKNHELLPGDRVEVQSWDVQ